MKLFIIIVSLALTSFAQAANEKPFVNASVYRMRLSGEKELIKNERLILDENSVIMLKTDLNEIYCSFSSHQPSSTHQTWIGTRCSLYGNKNDLLSHAIVSAYYPFGTEQGSKELFKDERGRQYLLRIGPTSEIPVGKTDDSSISSRAWNCEFSKKENASEWIQIEKAILPIFDWTSDDSCREAQLRDLQDGLTAQCTSRQTTIRDYYGNTKANYQELDCGIKDEKNNTLVQAGLHAGNQLVLRTERHGVRYKLQCTR